MLGFIHRLYIEHLNDDENPLIYLKLCFPYRDTGIFKAGNSYVIRTRTKSRCFSEFEKLRRLKKIIPNPTDPNPFRIDYGTYMIREYKKMYSEALFRYVCSLTELGDAFRYIENVNKEISYLEYKIRELRPDWRSILSTEVIFT